MNFIPQSLSFFVLREEDWRDPSTKVRNLQVTLLPNPWLSWGSQSITCTEFGETIPGMMMHCNVVVKHEGCIKRKRISKEQMDFSYESAKFVSTFCLYKRESLQIAQKGNEKGRETPHILFEASVVELCILDKNYSILVAPVSVLFDFSSVQFESCILGDSYHRFLSFVPFNLKTLFEVKDL